MRLALGTAQFGLAYGIANKAGQVNLTEGQMLLNLAAKNGISMLDTAISYGDSQSRLGKLGVQEWDIVSKIPEIPRRCINIAQWIEDQVSNSLNQLGARRLYGLLLHRPQQLLGLDRDLIYQALIKLKANGFVKKIGVSIYDPSELDLLIKEFDFDLVQAPFSVLDRRILDSGWLAKLSSLKVEVHARSVFLQGLLLMSRGDMPNKFERWNLLWDKWFSWLEESGMSPVDACLRYVLSFPEVTKVIVGVESITQLNQIIFAVNGSTPNVPQEISVNDINLINPTLWNALEFFE